MTHFSRIQNRHRQIAAALLAALPALTALACYAHGHGSLSGPALGVVTALFVTTGIWGANLLLRRSGSAQIARRHAIDLQLSR